VKRLCVIPARGGSKRIPRKNIKEFCGEPMIARSIQAAKKTKLFDRVIVSTDSAEIGEVALRYGAEIPFMRPADLSDDFTGTLEVVRHAVIACEKAEKTQYDLICCLYATAPFVLPEDLQAASALLEYRRKEAEFVIPVTGFPFPVQRAVYQNAEGALTPLYPEMMVKRSQDLTEALHDCGQFYWATRSAWLNAVSIWGSKVYPLQLPRSRVQDIDTPEDWERAELMFQALIKKEETV
jgi:pseudaminic acid cytidylyltransferase